MSHCFSGDKCVDCGKSFDELFYELLEIENDEALRYNHNIVLGSVFLEAEQRRIVMINHTHCLTPDEKMIKDLIE